ncbi:methyl-accepting chemotaxis protein [Paucibacter sp. APW11]|uniref:Methyl-accepting chemotaxis protein n=1 Tax=Roseateles aquae TaxID=3077235 RepID=A0ABU3PGT5_9BURK|nr:methyl-accepting chemotaxis protein [Paucibacter sp. APW11]MDT9001713.1 methyl-accepting chemotaxis protein [Paucibacter sp. APW11]
MNAHPALAHVARTHDRVMTAIIAANALIAALLSQASGQLSLGAGGGLLGALLAGAILASAGGRPASRLLLAALNVAMVALQLKVSQGAPAVAANVFVSLCLLLPYRDWRPLALSLGLYALHHLVFQVFSDKPLFTAPSSGPNRIWVYYLLLSMLGATLVMFAARLEREAKERFELEFLVNAMGREGAIRLNLEVVRTDSPVGSRLKMVQERMAKAMRRVRDAVFSLHGAAQEVGSSSEELMSRTDQTANGLRDAAMSLEQINVIVQDSARASREARELSSEAIKSATRGGEVVAHMVNTMQEIEQSSRRITDIISVIDSIAFQTNILALNAAVEAARAGEQGRGFAVVAAEVRMLAGRSSEAAKEIKQLISASMETVERGTRQASEAGAAMGELVGSVQRVGKVYESITADSSEHAQGIDVVTMSVKELDQVTRQNLHVAERSREIANELELQAAELAEVLSAFRLGDDAALLSLLEQSRQALAQQRGAGAAKSSATANEGGASTGIEFF